MPRLNKHFFDEVAKVLSYRAEQNKSAPLLRAANGESKDSIDGEPTLTEALWSKAKNDRVNVLSTCFIEGLRNGTQDPIQFGVFCFEDVVYCLKTLEALEIAAGKASGDVKKTLEHSITSYEEYSKVLIDTWRVSSPDAVTLGKSIAQYIQTHLRIAKELDPIYTILSLIPCERLWPWIGAQIQSSSAKFGVYRGWIKDNFAGEGYKHIEEFINQHEALIDRRQAENVYMECMRGELGFFNSP